MFNKTYILYLTITALITINIIAVLFLEKFDLFLKEKERELRMTRSQVLTIKNNLNELLSLKEQLGIKFVTRNEAEKIILESMDILKKRYSAKIIKGPEISASMVSAELSINLKPKNSKSLINILTSLEKSVFPVIRVKYFSLTNEQNGSMIKIKISLTQPYTGGK
ncbi:hypothetical protein [Persephonella sp.]